MTAKQIHGIDGILGDLISAPCQQRARAVETAHLIEEVTPSTPAGGPPPENHGGSVQGARRGRPFGTRSSAVTSRENPSLTENTYDHYALDEKAEAIAALSPPPKAGGAGDADNQREQPDPVTIPTSGTCLVAAMVVGPGVHDCPQMSDDDLTPPSEGYAESGRNSLSESSLACCCQLLTGVDQVHPTGFEPVTLGSVDCRPDDASSCSTRGLRHEPNDAVPTLVPSSSQPNSAEILPPPADPDLDRIVSAWPNLPEPIRVGIIAMVNAAIGDRT